jgi:phage tail-like protein
MQGRIPRRWLLLAVAVALGAGGVTASSLGAAAPPSPSLAASRYALSVDGVELGSFSQLSGIATEVQAPEFVGSGDTSTINKQLPGKAKPPSITLKRSATQSSALWAWHAEARAGAPGARKSAALTMFNPEGKAVARFVLENAWPAKLEIAGLKAGATETLIEKVTLSAESVRRVAP